MQEDDRRSDFLRLQLNEFIEEQDQVSSGIESKQQEQGNDLEPKTIFDYVQSRSF